MPSTDVDGSPVLILSRKEADHVFVIMSHVMLSDDEAKVLGKIKTFLREATGVPYPTELPRPGDVSELPRGVM
jgi:hypothetical protein